MKSAHAAVSIHAASLPSTMAVNVEAVFPGDALPTCPYQLEFLALFTGLSAPVSQGVASLVQWPAQSRSMPPVPAIMAPVAGVWASLLGGTKFTGTTTPNPRTMTQVPSAKTQIAGLSAPIPRVEVVFSAIPVLVAGLLALFPEL